MNNPIGEQFPILRSIKYERKLKSIPLSLLNEEWATNNHGQSLSQLAKRGGLSPLEAVANIKKCSYLDIKRSEEWCQKALAQFVEKHGGENE